MRGRSRGSASDTCKEDSSPSRREFFTLTKKEIFMFFDEVVLHEHKCLKTTQICLESAPAVYNCVP